ASVSPTRSREFDRTRSCGSLVWVTTCGLDGSVTSTTEKLIGAHSWAMYMMRRPSRVFCSPIPSPPLPKPPRSLWPIKRMFLLSVPLAVAGALIDVSSVSCVWNTCFYVGVRCCSILPVKRREVTIVLATGVVPGETEHMQMALRRPAQRQARVGGVEGIVDVQRFARVRHAAHLLDCLLQHARDGYRPLQATPLVANGLHLRAQECADEAAQGGHGATCLATGDGRDGLLLLRCGPLIENEADRPIALTHHGWRRTD